MKGSKLVRKGGGERGRQRRKGRRERWMEGRRGKEEKTSYEGREERMEKKEE